MMTRKLAVVSELLIYFAGTVHVLMENGSSSLQLALLSHLAFNAHKVS